MKRIVLVAALASAMFVSGCTPEQEAKWSAAVSSIQAGVTITSAAARQTLDEVCAQQSLVIPAAQGAVALAQSRGNGPRTRSAVNAINAGIAGYAAACQGGSANLSVATLVVRAWNAYQAIKDAQAAAQAAAGA
jgi:hypothetical protein